MAFGNEKYKIWYEIGSGTFGRVFLGMDRDTKEEVAIKCERINSRHRTLETEFAAYEDLTRFGSVSRGVSGIARIIDTGTIGSNNILVMQLLGPSLEDLFGSCRRCFSDATVRLLAIQLISRLEYVHSCGILHRDVKPENFAMGSPPNEHIVYILDFGLAKRYKTEGDVHAQQRNDCRLVGTVRYCSINSHIGVQLSRRDDLEALGYMLIYFLKGSLPWQGIGCPTKKELHERVKEMKMSIPIKKLCKDVPKEYNEYLEYCRGLTYEQEPDYKYLRGLFAGNSAGEKKELIYDWEKLWVAQEKQTNEKLFY